jgi:hypothetical protein
MTETRRIYRGLTPSKAMSIIWASVLAAFVQTILVLAMGTLAVGMFGDLIGDMLPSLPPPLKAVHLAGAGTSGYWHALRSTFQAHGFVLLFAILSTLTAVSRLASASRPEALRKSGRRMRAFGRRLSSKWFDFIVVNALGALISAFAVVWIQQWSVTQMVLQWLPAWLLPEIQEAVGSWLGQDALETLNGWISWYGGNQFKFAFWLFYIGSICDDLGVPNFKTLARGIWNRVRTRKPAHQTPGDVSPVEGSEKVISE